MGIFTVKNITQIALLDNFGKKCPLKKRVTTGGIHSSSEPDVWALGLTRPSWACGSRILIHL
jgi:hypothetical protein